MSLLDNAIAPERSKPLDAGAERIVRQRLTEELDHARRALEAPQSEPVTAGLRGEIRALRRLLAWVDGDRG